MAEVIAAQAAPNQQQQQDGLPVWTMYRDTPGSPQLPGPRSPGMSAWPNGRTYDNQGFIQGGPQDPAPSPLQLGFQAQAVPGMAAPVAFTPPPVKVMWEPPQYVPGQGWVGLDNTQEAGGSGTHG